MPARIFRIRLFVLGTALCGAAVLGLAAPGQSASQTRSSSTESHPDIILVFPFENGSRLANLDWLGEGLSELTAGRLEDRQLYALSRQDRLATLEKMGLPDSARFSHASMVKIATEADADAIIYGHFKSDGQTVTLEARLLRLNPPSLSPTLTETSAMQDLLRAHARLTWQILCQLDRKNCLPGSGNRDESSFSEPPPSLRLDALKNFVQALSESRDEERVRMLREAARLEPAWDRPAFELGQAYFARHDCELALVWYSRVPPNRPEGPEANFAAGVCHLLRNDAARAEASFTSLLERTRNPQAKDALPELPEMHNNLGVARFRLGKWNDAGAEFERAATLDPEEADYWVNLGLAKLAAKQPAAAVPEFERARKISPDDKEARALVVSTLDSLGRSAEAVTIRAEVAESGEKPALPNVQDAPGLARLARVSRNVDRTLLRLAGELPEAQAPADKGALKLDGSGDRQ